MTDTVLTIEGNEYLVQKIHPIAAWNIVRQLLPIFARSGPLVETAIRTVASGSPQEAGTTLLESMGPVADALAKMSDEDSQRLIEACLRHCRRRASAGWLPVEQFQADLTLTVYLTLVGAVLRENVSGFFSALAGLVSSVGGRSGTSIPASDS